MTDYPNYTPYHYVHQNPINLIDPTGMEAEWIPGTDGKAIDYKFNEDGNVEFSENTPDDLKDVMSEMVKSKKGDEVLRKAIDSKTKINVTISDKTGPDNAKTGEIWFGRNKAVDYDRKKDLIFESDITIYKGTFSNLKNDGTKVWSFGTRGKSDLKNLKYSGLLNINQNMAGALGHELMHTLDPKSSSALYPKLPESSIEALPEEVGKQIHYDLIPDKYKP